MSDTVNQDTPKQDTAEQDPGKQDETQDQEQLSANEAVEETQAPESAEAPEQDTPKQEPPEDQAEHSSDEPKAEAADETAADAATPAAEAGPADGDAPAAKPKKRGRPRAKLNELEVGSEFKGKVVGLAKFGAFVDIGAVTDGLVHVTELSQKRVRKVEDAVSMGDEVEVWIKDVDLNSGRVSLSMRRRPSRPLAELKSGDVLAGTVTSTTKYGVFVDIGSETEGLVHISEMSSGYVERPSDVASSGDPVEVRIKEIDSNRERISLSMIGLANDVGLEAAAENMAVAEYNAGDMVSDEPEERMPTVVELALRRALGEMQDDADVETVDADAPAADVEAEAEAAAEAVEAPADEAPADEAAADDAPADDAAADEAGDKEEGEDGDSLGEMYERMIEAYKAEKQQS